MKLKSLFLSILFILVMVSTASAFEAAIRWTEPAPWQFNEIGDIIQVAEDGFPWGTGIDPRLNPNSNFIIVQVTGVDPALGSQYFQELYTFDHPNWKARKFKLDTQKIPQNVLTLIRNNNGFVTVTEGQWNSFITNKEGLL